MLAVAAPSESNLMGRLPFPTAQRLVAPSGLGAGRTLALVGFSSSQRHEIRSWIEGLRLNQDSGIAWVKMPVIKDPGSEDARLDVERKLVAKHDAAGQRVRVVPVFTNQDEFVRAAGLSGTEHASVLVLNREGMVLARASGQFDETKAQALRETLGQRN
jgi:hypothetical protein